jgi:hypothetical protein
VDDSRKASDHEKKGFREVIVKKQMQLLKGYRDFGNECERNTLQRKLMLAIDFFKKTRKRRQYFDDGTQSPSRVSQNGNQSVIGNHLLLTFRVQ